MKGTRRKAIILSLYFLSISFCLTAQEGISYHFYPELAQQNIINSKVDSNLTLSISGFGYTHLLSNTFSLGDVSTVSGNERIIDLDMAKDQLKDNNLQEFSAELNVLHIEYYLSNLSLKAGYNQKNFAQASYPKELYALMADGNVQFIGQTVTLDPSVEISSYHEIYGGFSFQMDKLHLGANLKFLSGIGNLHTEKTNIALSTSDEIYQLEFVTDYEVQTSGVLDYNSYDDIVLEFNRAGFKSPFIGNYGYGIDLGLDYYFNDKSRVFASVQNLGSMTWDLRGTSYKSEGTYAYNGIDIIDYLGIDDEPSFRDSLESLLQVEESDLDYQVATPITITAGIQYDLGNGLDVGALINSRKVAGTSDHAIGLHLRRQFASWLTLGGSYTNRFQTYENIGLSALIKFWRLQGFISTENVLSVYDPLGRRNFSLSGGVSFRF